jgi:hypothetical protein
VSTTRPRSTFPDSTTRSAIGSCLTSRGELRRRESSRTASVGGFLESTSNATTRELVATANSSIASGQSNGLSGSRLTRGAAEVSSWSSLASTRSRSSDGTTIRYAVASAPATIAASPSARRTLMPPAIFTLT